MKPTNNKSYTFTLSADLLEGLRERHQSNLSEVIRTLLLDHMTKPSEVQQPVSSLVLFRTKDELISDLIDKHPNYTVKRIAKEAKSSVGYVHAVIRRKRGELKPKPVIQKEKPASLFQKVKNLMWS
jgi:hypothetical protein